MMIYEVDNLLNFLLYSVLCTMTFFNTSLVCHDTDFITLINILLYGTDNFITINGPIISILCKSSSTFYFNKGIILYTLEYIDLTIQPCQTIEPYQKA